MSNQIGIGNRSRDNIDLYVAAAGMVISAVLIVVLFFIIGKYVEVGVTVLLACGTYVIVRNTLGKQELSEAKKLLRGPQAYIVFDVLFFTVFLLSLISLITRESQYSRPIEYYVSIAAMCSILAAQIVLIPKQNKYHGFTLVKIMLLGLNLLWTPQFIFPGLVGVDTWFHQTFTNTIIDSGYVPEGTVYSDLPIMHLVISSISLITGLGYKMSVMFSITVFHVVGLVFVYLTCRHIVGPKLGLLACLLLSSVGSWIIIGTGVIPTTLALVYLSWLVYIVIKIYESKRLVFDLLFILVSFVLILTHTLTALAFGIALIVFLLGSWLYNALYGSKGEPIVSIYNVAFYWVAMLTVWTYLSHSITTFIQVIVAGFRFGKWEVSNYYFEYHSTVPFGQYLLAQAGFMLLFGLGIVGTLYMVSKYHGKREGFTLVLAGQLFVLIAFAGLALHLSGFLPYRWWWYANVIIVIPAAVGLYLICSRWNNNIVAVTSTSAAVFILSFLYITSPNANFDNRFYTANTASRIAFTQSEITSMDNISIIWKGVVGVATAEEQYYYLHINGINTVDIATNLSTKDFSNLEDVFVVIRDEVVSNYFDSAGGGIKITYDPNIVLEAELFDSIYTSGSTRVFLK